MRILLIIMSIMVVVGCSKREVRTAIPENQQPAELLKYGNQFYNSGDYENAFRAYGIIYYNFPSSREYIDAAIGLSRCYGALENYEKEFDILHTLLQGNLIPSKVPQIYNAIAEFYERSAGISEQLTGAGDEDYQTAISYYEKAISYPNSKDSTAQGLAKYKIGVLYEKLGDTQKAIETYQETINQYANTEWAQRAEQAINDINERMRLRAEYEQNGWLTPANPVDSTAVQQENVSPPDSDQPAMAPPRESGSAPVDSTTALPDSSAHPE